MERITWVLCKVCEIVRKTIVRMPIGECEYARTHTCTYTQTHTHTHKQTHTWVEKVTT